MAAKAAKPQQGKKGNQSQGFDDTNRGVLFENDKGDNEARPDMTGSVAIKPDDYSLGDDGLIHIRIAAWRRRSEKSGQDYLSLAASPAQKE